MHSHTSYFGPIVGQSQKATHSDDTTVGCPDVKLTSRGDVLGVNAVQIVVPGAASCMGVNLEQRNVVELPNDVMVRGEISTNLHHAKAGRAV